MPDTSAAWVDAMPPAQMTTDDPADNWEKHTEQEANTDHDGGEIEARFAFRQTKDCIANQKFMDQLGE